MSEQQVDPGTGANWPSRADWLVVLAFGLASAGFVPLVHSLAGQEGVLAAVTTTLGACVVWVGLLTPALCAGGRGIWGAMLRGCAPADGVLVGLVILVIALGEEGRLTLLGALKVYAVLATLALVCISAVCAFMSRRNRPIAAMVVAMLVIFASATPFWMGGIINHASYPLSVDVLSAGVRVNPVFGVFGAVVDDTGFHWHQWRWMYYIFDYGAYGPLGEVKWHVTVMIYAVLAGMILAAGSIRRFFCCSARSGQAA